MSSFAGTTDTVLVDKRLHRTILKPVSNRRICGKTSSALDTDTDRQQPSVRQYAEHIQHQHVLVILSFSASRSQAKHRDPNPHRLSLEQAEVPRSTRGFWPLDGVEFTDHGYI